MSNTPRVRILSDEIATLRDRRRIAPRRFVASVNDAIEGAPGVEVELEIEVGDDGTSRCRSIAARGESVTGDLLRRIPVANLVRAATDEAATSIEIKPPKETEVVSVEGMPRVTLTGPGSRRLGRRLRDQHYEEVAEIYRDAVKRGDAPKQAVAKAMGVSVPTAGRYVMEARNRGLLGPTTPGRAGEQSTEEQS